MSSLASQTIPATNLSPKDTITNLGDLDSPLNPVNGDRFYSQKNFESAMHGYLREQFGINSTSKKDCRKNDDPVQGHVERGGDGTFPYKGTQVIVCKSCKPEGRDACGFLLKATLVTKKKNSDGPFLMVTQFDLPSNSVHQLRGLEKDTVDTIGRLIRNEADLTPMVSAFLHSCGRRRLTAYKIRSMLQDLYPGVEVHPSLLYRVLEKGRKEAYGTTDDSSMIQFMELGIAMKSAGGSFVVHTDSEDNSLIQWSAQTKTEKLIMDYYGRTLIRESL